MKKSIALLAFLASLSAVQAAVTINLSGNPTTGPQFFIGNTGTLVADGSVVRLGTFDVAPAVGATFESLAASFQEFGRTTVGTDNASGANTGRIQRSGIAGIDGGTSVQPDSFFATKPVYIWIVPSNLPANVLAAGGIFGSATTFKDQATAVSVSMTTFSPIGQFAAGGDPTSGANPTYRLATVPVPEPGVSILALASLGLLARRRRN